ncbi:hypothetical protein N7481_010043 [Penicillium waksmanii]|uniref:uncharacterized protein n=1 Tax=Penicillium waksmanii TaxID=69791 RepID=UPI002546F380|nr:uncharacterized protein N7481_010043 [Penicillium waksmanii]KAJ5976336.1 hypothetical protein N7481_010043 [Penicillium waksmanii]
MTFREKVRRVFHRSSASQDTGRPKVEYYRRHECPPSKFRGPFDKEHQKRLAAWSFDRATMERTRSLDLALSPCATFDLPGPNPLMDPMDSDDSGEISPRRRRRGNPRFRYVEQSPSSQVSPSRNLADTRPPPSSYRIRDQDILNSRPTNHGSQSSTVVNSDSFNGSMMTLLNENSVYDFPEDPISQLKESIRYSSPIVRTLSPISRTPRKGMHQPFAPEDLTRALVAVQLCA